MQIDFGPQLNADQVKNSFKNKLNSKNKLNLKNLFENCFSFESNDNEDMIYRHNNKHFVTNKTNDHQIMLLNDTSN